jgi:N4-gp56 family major capsid protein
VANLITGGGSGQTWDLLTETAYDRDVRYYLRDEPKWRQMCDVAPRAQAMPGDVVVLTLHNAMPLATTPLTELVDVDAVQPPAPSRVSVTMNEYGNATIDTLRLETLAFTQPKREITELLGRNQQDSIDAIIRVVADTGTNKLFVNGGATLSTIGSAASVTATDIMARKPSVVAGKLLERAKVNKRSGGMWLGIIHPDVAYDLQAEVGATTWNAPHTSGTDTAAIYTGVTGSFMGTAYVETTRTTINTTVASPVNVYTTYVFGAEAIAEVPSIEPGTRIGLQTDKLKRFFPIGWYALFGHAMFRQAALVQVQTASSIAGIL